MRIIRLPFAAQRSRLSQLCQKGRRSVLEAAQYGGLLIQAFHHSAFDLASKHSDESRKSRANHQ
jgi:hypothetical protein